MVFNRDTRVQPVFREVHQEMVKKMSVFRTPRDRENS